MKIACLQFAPQVGDVDNNLNRADAVLNRADTLALEDLDLLVLPELAFTGYNFRSLRHISPYLERSGAGITALWARAKALKYNCNVVVGYPEKVDVSSKWPTSPEYYNSAIMVNGDGETIGNYRKSFLYPKDERWALESKEGFFKREIPGLGNTVMGICMDLNPYKFEAAWNEFEFAYHILRARANLVILSMSWITSAHPGSFSRTPQEPDVETLTYWVQRLEPVIRAETQDEIIVVICNRCGNEDEMLYCGTSAVLGLRDGEVSVYGLLGRGAKEVLIVDTEKSPFAKLVQRLVPEAEDSEFAETATESITPAPWNTVPWKLPSPSLASGNGLPRSDTAVDHGLMITEKPESENGNPARKNERKEHAAHTEPSRSEIAELETSRPAASSPVVSPTSKPVRKVKPTSPKLQIPYTPTLDEISSAIALSASTDYSNTGSMGSSNIPTPTAPSPVSPSLRPKMRVQSPIEYQHKATPYPMSAKQQTFIYGGEVSITAVSETMTPVTPFFDHDDTPLSPRSQFWRPSFPFGGPVIADCRYAQPETSRRIPAVPSPCITMPGDGRLASIQSAGIVAGKEPESPKTAAPLTAIPLTAVPVTAFPATPSSSRFPDHSSAERDSPASPVPTELEPLIVPERLKSLSRSKDDVAGYHATIPIAASPSVFASFATPHSAVLHAHLREVEFDPGISRPPSKIPCNRERSRSRHGRPLKMDIDSSGARSPSQSRRPPTRLGHRSSTPTEQSPVANHSYQREIVMGRQPVSKGGEEEIPGSKSLDMVSDHLEHKSSI